MKKKRLFIGILILVLILFFNVFTYDKEGIKDNYYYAINKEVIDNNELEDNEYSWSYFLEAQKKVDERVSLVVDDILSGKVSNLDKREIDVINKVYNSAIDIGSRNKQGIRDLEPYLNRVWGVSNVNELVDVIMLVENELGIGILSNIEVIQDYSDNSKNIIYFYPVTYAFGASSDYMVNEDYMAYKAYVRRACVQLWKVYGLDEKEARSVVTRVFTFYEGVSNVSKLNSDLGSIDKYYNIVTEDEVNGLFSNVKGKYLSRRGIGGKDSYSIVDFKQYQYLNDSLVSDNLSVWKEVIITKILSSYASYGAEEYVEVVDNLNKALLGDNDDNSIDKKAKEIVKSLFTSEIDKVYEEEYLDNEQLKEIEDIFEEIKIVFKRRLNNNKWLSNKAKEKGIEKLEKMKLIVGIGDVDGYSIASKLSSANNSLISDVIKIQKIIMQDDLRRLESGEKRNLVSQTQVNAYYQPLDNSIVIPVAFLELINKDNNYYEKLGTMGMILAHEVTHAFDSNGSKFDEDGNLSNWWSEEDKKTFEVLKQEVSDYYSKYEVLDGKYINGDITVNENIADLGAMACIVDIAKERNASDKDISKMFSSFANIWASRESREYMELLLLQDVHSPNEFRVNAVLSSTDEFYQVYNIYPWDNMWINKDDRVIVW